MVTNCDPLVADFFFFFFFLLIKRFYESDDNQAVIIEAFNSTSSKISERSFEY